MKASTYSGVAFAACATFMICATAAEAARIDPALESRMQTAAADEFLKVVIRPIGTLMGSALKKQVAAQYATRAEQHRATVEALQATARQTQPAILNAINSVDYTGRVINAENFWIDNIITAEMTPSAVAEIASRADVDEVLLMPDVRLVRPAAVADATDAPSAASIQPGLRAIKADSVWKQGYTGKGRLVASLDTGVDGDQGYLSSGWRGNNGYSPAESWFDPLYRSTTPRIYPSVSRSGNSIHGTQVMGIMVGRADIPRFHDTLGVCPDCEWISAASIEIPCPANPQVPCFDFFQSLQWVADPDGDPLTAEDVPDAVANPWGVIERPEGCLDIFWNAIDNIEAAGAMMIFAAGNYDETASPPVDAWSRRVWNPGNRTTTDVNAFSVGMIDANVPSFPVDTLSSRGPSGCDNRTIKPEVVAPGVNVTSAIPTDQPGGLAKGIAYGTSFAAPHVAAAAAVLREFRPNATVDQIKTAMLLGARDLGPAGPDNDYGNGILDMMGALRVLEQTTPVGPHIYVKRDYQTLPLAGTTDSLVILLRSTGTAVTGVNVTMVSEDSRLTILNGSAAFANLPLFGDTAANRDDPFVFSIAEGLLAGEHLGVRFDIMAAGGYARTWRAAIQIGPAQTAEVFTHNAGNFTISVVAEGMFGAHRESLSPRPGGQGYLYGADPTLTLYEGGFLVGTDAGHLSDNVRDHVSDDLDMILAPDADFHVEPGGRLEVMEPGRRYAEETRAAFDDSPAENPIGVFVEQRTWVSDSADQDDYLVIEYTIWNHSGDLLTNLHAGLFFDWDFPWGSGESDRGGFNADEGVGWMDDSNTDRLRGVEVVYPPELSMHHYRYLSNYRDLGDGDLFSEADKWNAMTQRFTRTMPDTLGDASHLIAAGPFSILPDSAVKVAFAVIGATSEDDLLAFARAARANYVAGTLWVSPRSLTFEAEPGGTDPVPKNVDINNGTDLPVHFDAANSQSWASIDPDSGTVGQSEPRALTVTVTLGDLAVGTYRDTIVITTDDPEHRVFRIPITLRVEEPPEAAVDPNPFNPNKGTVKIAVEPPAGVQIQATIYDIAGEEVTDLDDPSGIGGKQVFEWDGRTDGRKVASGVYLCRITARGSGSFSRTLKIVVKRNAG